VDQGGSLFESERLANKEDDRDYRSLKSLKKGFELEVTNQRVLHTYLKWLF
jgi:hypothetical protein